MRSDPPRQHIHLVKRLHMITIIYKPFKINLKIRIGGAGPSEFDGRLELREQSESVARRHLDDRLQRQPLDLADVLGRHQDVLGLVADLRLQLGGRGILLIIIFINIIVLKAVTG